MQGGPIVRFVRRLVSVSFALPLALQLAGCAPFLASNKPLAHWDPDYGYRPKNTREQRGMGDVLLILAFSGGGTRASALAYGVLEELRDTRIADGRMLDEVDSITSVSGGSFTAAYYGLYGDRIFDDFEQRMLKTNLQGALIRGLVNPLNWWKLASGYFDRSEIAVALYDDKVFDHKTFADIQARPGPLIQINATDLAAGNFFTFFQPQFDLLCSDLTPFSVARAVTASSAVPGAFSPIPLRNYAGSCGFQQPPWFGAALASRKTDPRRYRAAKILSGYLDAKQRPYIHLLDGGIADNIGLRVPLQNVMVIGGPAARLEELGGRLHFREILVIVVNSEVHPEEKFSLSSSAPGLAAVMGSISNTQIYSYNFDTIQLMRENIKTWSRSLPPGPDGRPVGASLIQVDFESIEDPKERAFFNSIPTALGLPDSTVDRLVALGHQLLRESPDYQAIVAHLQQPVPVKQPPVKPTRKR
jgi:NTE family protein